MGRQAGEPIRKEDLEGLEKVVVRKKVWKAWNRCCSMERIPIQASIDKLKSCQCRYNGT
jgi:hypothetical protein